MISQPFPSLLRTALHDPRAAARVILDARLPETELWLMLVLGAILSVLPTHAYLAFGELPEGDYTNLMREAFPFPPIVSAVLQWGQAAIGVIVVYWVGSAFGAAASRHDILAIFAVLQLISLVLIYAITAIGLVIPILTAFALLIFVCWWVYAVVLFVDEAYGFGSPFKTAFILVGALVATLICSSIALSLVGAILLGTLGGT